MLRNISRLRCRFATSKKIKLLNLFTKSEILTVTSPEDKDITQLVAQTHQNRIKWSSQSQQEKERVIGAFVTELESQENIKIMSQTLSGCTGKELQEAEIQMKISLKILRNHLNHAVLPYRKYERDYYKSQPFDSIISIYDHTNPILFSFQYLGVSLKSQSSLILRPSHSVLPVVKHLESLWNGVSPYRLIHCLADPYDPKHENSPVLNLLRKTQGFLRFSGRIQQGFDFHHYTMKNSDSFRQSQYLLTSCDSAYVMKDLSPQNLEKTAKIVTRGAFSNAGSNFNSIKRVYVDRQIGQKFMDLLFLEASNYTISPQILGQTFVTKSTIPSPREDLEFRPVEYNSGRLAPIFLTPEYNESMGKIQKIKTDHKEEFKLITGGEGVSVGKDERQLKFIKPAIFKVQADFPSYLIQNEEFPCPILFVFFVDSVDAAIERINSSHFGITCSLFTNNNSLQNIEKIGKKLDVGTVNVNTWEVTDGVTYSGRKRSGKSFSFAGSSIANIIRIKAVSFDKI